MIGNKFNMDDVWFRDLTICTLARLEGSIKWNNRFTDKAIQVEVPIYYSLTGDERFLLDSFSDDVVSSNRYIELNTDLIPRGHLTLTSFNINSDEFSNPNVWLKTIVENESEVRRTLSKVQAIPVTVSYELTILLDSEIDTFKCSQAIMDSLWIYKYMYFEHNLMNIDAVINVPDTNSIELVRDKNMTSDNSIKMKVNFEVHTYYPSYRKDKYGIADYYNDGTSGMRDSNGVMIEGNPTNFYNTDSTVSPNTDNNIIDDENNSNFSSAKRNKWYVNILKNREQNRKK